MTATKHKRTKVLQNFESKFSLLKAVAKEIEKTDSSNFSEKLKAELKRFSLTSKILKI